MFHVSTWRKFILNCSCVRNGAVESPKSLSYEESLARIFSQKEQVSHNMTISMVKVLQSYHTVEEENGYYEKMNISSVMESSNTIIPIPPNWPHDIQACYIQDKLP